jgi:hypothetical protein
MNTHPDFEELLRLLEEHSVESMIVGGLIRNKKATPRAKDKGDVEELTQPEDVTDGYSPSEARNE